MRYATRSAGKRWIAAAALGIALACITDGAAKADVIVGGKEKAIMTMTIQSSSFQHNGEIPARHTCDGKNISPELSWTGVPPGTKSLVLIVDDPDAPDPAAPRMTWVHWVLYNLPANTNGLPENVAASQLPAGTMWGINDWQRPGYGGPCPPIGSHRYYHKLFALDVVLPDLKHPTKAALEKAMHGHIIAQSSLIGLYRRH